MATDEFKKIYCDITVGQITVRGIVSGPPIAPPLTSAQKVKEEGLSQHHLPGSQHAAPAAVRGQRGAGQWGKLLSVGEPNPGPKVSAEILHITHDTFLIRGLSAGFCLAFIL